MGSHPAKSRRESGGVWTVICPGKQHFANLLDSSRPARGLLHTEEVTGSVPVSPTRSEATWISIELTMGAISITRGSCRELRELPRPSSKNETEVRAKFAKLHDELNDGVVTNASYTVAHAIEDWLADGLAGRAPKTVSTQREVLEPLIDIIGAVPLRELSAATVRRLEIEAMYFL
jgi:hypothetical protein